MFKRRSDAIRATVFICLTLLAAVPLLAALSTAISPVGTIPSQQNFTTPVSIVNDWQTLVTAIDTADNSGSIVLVPGGITRSAQRQCNTRARCTSAKFRIRYTTGTTITACTIQPFGFDSAAAPERLKDSGGTHALAFVSDATNDVQDGTYSYTDTQTVDALGANYIMAAIKVAATGTGAATAVLQVMVN